MGIVGNYSVLHKSPTTFMSGTVASGDRASMSKSGSLRNRFLGGISKKSAIPNGYVHPYSWAIAQESGGLATYTSLSADVSATDLRLALGVAVSAAIAANISTTNATLALIVALEAALSAGVVTTDANLALLVLLQANISASVSTLDANLINVLNLAAALAASGILTDVALVNLVNLSADISSQTELSPESLAAAILNAVAGDYNQAGSIGEKINDAGSAGNPWAALLDDNNDPGTFGERTQKLLTVAKFLGLK